MTETIKKIVVTGNFPVLKGLDYQTGLEVLSRFSNAEIPDTTFTLSNESDGTYKIEVAITSFVKGFINNPDNYVVDLSDLNIDKSCEV